MAAGHDADPDKRTEGRYYTTENPFDHPAVAAWTQTVPDGVWCEPYAGARNLVTMFDHVYGPHRWACFDIAPAAPEVTRWDTLEQFPAVDGLVAVVTNPPYMAKNTAARTGRTHVVAACGPWDNLYKRAIADALAACTHVAAIIPESFITSRDLDERVCDIVSLPVAMFADTEVPVALALFAGEAGPVRVWSGHTLLGTRDQLAAALPTASADVRVRFNDPDGRIGLRACDTTAGDTIAFCRGEDIDPAAVRGSSRHVTRISIDGEEDVDALVDAANAALAQFRRDSADVTLTAFMGLRRDGRYRRRLDYRSAAALLGAAAAGLRGQQPAAGGQRHAA